MDRLKVGVIGVGTIGKTHLHEYSLNKKAEIVGIADLDNRLLKETSRRFKVKNSFTNYHDLINMDELDAVSICTPPHNHASITLDCVSMRKHVLVEKPMAINANEAEEMVLASNKKKVKLGVCSARSRFFPQVVMAKKHISEGKIGRIYYGRVSFYRRRGRPGIDILKNSSWFIDKSKAGGGALIDIGCYEIDMMLYLMDNPRPVSVNGATFQGIEDPKNYISVFDVEEHASVLVRFDNSFMAMFEISWAANFENTEETIFLGSKGGLRLYPFTYYTEMNGKQVAIQTDLLGNRFTLSNKLLIEDFINSCTEDAKPKTPGEQGLKVMQVIDAAYKSAKIGREVQITDS